MIKLIWHKVLRSVISDVRFQKWYLVMADETRDVINREQLVVTMHWVTAIYEIEDNFCGLLRLDGTTSECIYMTLSQYLVSLGTAFDNCRGQAYDGASNIQGHITGVARWFQMDNPAAISTHSLAQCVNLCLQELVRNIKSIKEALNFSTELNIHLNRNLFLRKFKVSMIAHLNLEFIVFFPLGGL